MITPETKAERRTRVSSVVYYGVILILGILALQSIRWTVAQFEQSIMPVSQLQNASWIEWSSLWGALQSPGLLTLAMIALILRNRAAVWLLGWWLAVSVPSIVMSLFSTGLATFIILLALGIPALAVCGLLLYLSERGEL